MAESDMERRTRRLDGFSIDGRPVFARNITNADLERKDEMDDELAELRLQLADLETKVDDSDDVDQRTELRREVRALMADIRNRDVLLLRLYVEDENGEPFTDEALLAAPFRVLTKVSRKATEYAFGVEDEDARPTTAGNASG